MNVFRWQKGRLGTGYKKVLLISGHWPVAFDVYLLRFLPGHEIPPHKDQVKEGKHHRVNIILKHAKVGGVFNCKAAIYNSRRIKYFRPDKSVHSVTKIVKGTRYVLSLGWINKP